MDIVSQKSLYGERLLPQVLDEFATFQPGRLYATIPCVENDLSQGFRDVTTKDMAHCVSVLAYWLQGLHGRSSDFETICYLGIPDLRGAMIFLAAVKCGYKVSPNDRRKVLIQKTETRRSSSFLPRIRRPPSFPA